MDNTNTAVRSNAVRIVIVFGLVLAAFLGAYRYAEAKSAPAAGSDVYTAFNATPVADGVATDPNAAGAGGGSCCGTGEPPEGGVTGELVEGTAKVAGGVQRIDVDLSSGSYNPNQIVLKAGVPAEITFGQSSGCTAQLVSEQLGFSEDLSAGPRTVKLAGLEPGEYAFACGMKMVFGKIVVK